jgi:hypothetical protein
MPIPDSPKIIYLILASSNREHERDLQAQIQTWANQDQENIFWLRGSESSSFKLEGRVLFVPCEEKYENILKKTLLGITWINKNIEYDFVLRTNVSTYVDTRKLREYIIKKKLTSESAAGYPEYLKISESIISERREAFLSGTGILLGRSIALELEKSKNLFSDSTPDDVAISRFLRRLGIQPLYLPRSNLHSMHLYSPAPLIRCKSSTNEYAASRRMKLVHRLISSPGWKKPIHFFESLCLEAYFLIIDPGRLPDEVFRYLAQMKKNWSSKENFWL